MESLFPVPDPLRGSAWAASPDMPAHRVQRRFVLMQEVAPVGHEVPDGTPLNQPVGVTGHVVVSARPGVVHRLADHPGSNGIALDIPNDREQVSILLDGKGVKAFLKEVPPDSFSEVNRAGVTPVSFSHRAGQGRRLGRNEDEVNVIGHQTPGPHLHVVLGRERREQLQVGLAIGVRRKQGQRAHAALKDVMGQPREDDAGHAGHGLMRRSSRATHQSLRYPVPGIPSKYTGR